MAQRGTFEVVGQALGEMLAPLEERLATPGGTQELFVELGIALPDTLLGQAAFANRLSTAATAAGRLPARLTALTTAIEAENVAVIVTASRDLLTDVTAVVTAIDAVATELRSAAASVGAIPAADVRAFAEELPERLVNLLAVEFLERNHRDLLAIFYFLGLVDEVVERADVDNPDRPSVARARLRPDRLTDLIQDPLDSLADLYRWGRPDLDAARMIEAVRRLLSMAGRLAYVEPGPGGQPQLRARDATLRPQLDVTPPGLDVVLVGALAGGFDVELELSAGLALHAKVEASVEASTTVTVQPPLVLTIAPPAVPVSGEVLLELVKRDPGGGPLILLGLPGGPRIQADALRVGAGADVTWDVPTGTAHAGLILSAAVEGGKVVVSLDGADGFLAAILPPDGLTLDVEFAMGWSSTEGLFFRGGVGLEVDVPVDLAVGPVKLSALHLALGPGSGNSGLALEASAAVGARLGPFAVAVERMGLHALLSFPAEGGNLQFAQLDLRFKPPTGIGLQLDAAVVRGGGFLYLDPDRGEYAGVLELAFGPVAVKAVGILTTKLPGGQPGWALLLVVFGEFPAIQLGFGFTLTGLGGIVGLQHGVSVEALQNGMRTGVLDAVLFPRDPVANAPQIINQLRVVFPITPRALTIGPALQIGWGTPPLLRVTVSVLFQLDNVLGSGGGDAELTRVVVLGKLEVQVPPVEDAGDDVPTLVRLVVDIVGAYEAREKQLSIDARLRDSHVALLPVVGSMALRANFGDHPRFMLAVGGFHPRFTDIPPGLPAQERLGIVLRYGILTVDIRGYLAITSNTFQVGAQASLVAAGGGFRAEAYLGFDALFIFQPAFHFEVDFRVGASLRYEGISLASADLRGTLSGPGHWRAMGKAEISLLFFDVTVGFTVEWGSAPLTPQPAIAVGALLAAALADPVNWVAQLPAGGDMLVTVRRVSADGQVVAHPLGELVVTQKIVPLGLDITHVDQARPSDGTRFDITSVEIGTVTTTAPATRREHFARATYLDLTEAQKLSTPSFEQFKAGVAVSTGHFRAPASQVAFEPDIETVYLGEPTVRQTHVLSPGWLAAHARIGAAARSELRRGQRLAGARLAVEVADDRFAVTSPTTMATVVPLAGDVARSFSLSSQASAAHAGPSQVVEAVELEVVP